MIRLITYLTLLSLLVFASSAMTAEQEFGSIGARVVPVATGELVVLEVVSGSSAEREGVKPGDLIFAVDGVKLAGTVFEEVARKLLWGHVGQTVTLDWKRPGVSQLFRATLVREKTDPRNLKDNSRGVKMIQPSGQ